MTISRTYSPRNLKRQGDSYEMSIYSGELTEKCIAECTMTIKHAFPSTETGFFKVFVPMLKECGFNDEKLLNSVKNVIKTCEYPTPTIAKFLNYDKKINLYTYTDMLKKASEDRTAFEKHKAVAIEGTKEPLWANVHDIEIYGLNKIQ